MDVALHSDLIYLVQWSKSLGWLCFTPVRAIGTPPRLPALGVDKYACCSKGRPHIASGARSRFVPRVFVANSRTFHAVTRGSTWDLDVGILQWSVEALSKRPVV